MTPEQQRFLLATYGAGWQTADLLLSDDAIPAAKAGQQGGSIHDGYGYARTHLGHYETTGRGIGTYELVRVEGKRWPDRVNEHVVIPWSAFGRHRATIPAAALDRLRDARAAVRQHQRTYPTPHPDLGVRKVGPNGDIHPDDRALYGERMDAYQADVVAPWRARADELDAAMVAAIRACLPAADGEPTDLLEMLAAGGWEA